MSNIQSKRCVFRGRSGEAAKELGINGIAVIRQWDSGAERLAGTVFSGMEGGVKLDA